VVRGLSPQGIGIPQPAQMKIADFAKRQKLSRLLL
jgi:hypothetical protein